MSRSHAGLQQCVKVNTSCSSSIAVFLLAHISCGQIHQLVLRKFITGPPNGPVLFYMLSSVGVVCRRLLRAWAVNCRQAGRVACPAADTARRDSMVTSG